ncbi:MAG: hypothetical protein QOJ46_632 [bacterium]|jgi:hypothetical protein
MLEVGAQHTVPEATHHRRGREVAAPSPPQAALSEVVRSARAVSPDDHLAGLLARAVAARASRSGDVDAGGIVLPDAPRARRAVQRLKKLDNGAKVSDTRDVIVPPNGKLGVREDALDAGRINLDALQGTGAGRGASSGHGSGSFITLKRGPKSTAYGYNWVSIIPKFTPSPLEAPGNQAELDVYKRTKELDALQYFGSTLPGLEDEQRNLRDNYYWVRTVHVNETGKLDDSENPVTSSDFAEALPMAGPADCEAFSALAQGAFSKGARRLSYVAHISEGGGPRLVPAQGAYTASAAHRNVTRGSSGFTVSKSGGGSLADEAMLGMVLPWIHDPANAAYLTAAHTTLPPNNPGAGCSIAADGFVTYDFDVLGPADAAFALRRSNLLYFHLTEQGKSAYVGDVDVLRDMDAFMHNPVNASYLTQYHKTLLPEERPYFRLDTDGIITFDTRLTAPNMPLIQKFGAKAAKDLYWALTDPGRDKFDRDYAINNYANPSVGQAYLIVTQEDAPGFASTALNNRDFWNQHWGAVVLVTGSDKVTLEGYAQSGRQANLRAEGKLGQSELLQVRDAIFDMHAVADPGTGVAVGDTFQAGHGASRLHGNRYLTFVVAVL